MLSHALRKYLKVYIEVFQADYMQYFFHRFLCVFPQSIPPVRMLLIIGLLMAAVSSSGAIDRWGNEPKGGASWTSFSSASLSFFSGNFSRLLLKHLPTSPQPSMAIEGVETSDPIVEIIDPLDGTTFNQGDDFEIEATATDVDGTIQEVSFYLNGNLFATETQPPYESGLQNVQPGAYELSAIAIDNDGLRDTAAIAFEVLGSGTGGDPFAPMVEIVSPLDGSDANVGDAILVEATASDLNGTIAEVAFYLNGALWLTEQDAPYTGQISNAQAGTYQLMAIAYDNDGFRDTSEISFSVGASNNQLPFVAVATPLSGSVFQPDAPIEIEVEAFDLDGTITEVEILVDGLVIQTDSLAPYEAMWQTNDVGEYLVAARAYDNSGQVVTAEASVITVQPGAAYVFGLALDATIDEGQVILSWTSQEEQFLEQYRLSRSRDSLIFEELTLVEAIGDSGTAASYQHLDPDPYDGISWYKLEAIATDNTVLQTLIIKVDLSEPDLLVNWTIFPNPLPAETPMNVWVILSKDAEVSTEINSVLGGRVWKENHQFYAGQNIIGMQAVIMPPGIYFLTLRLAQTAEVLGTRMFIHTP